MKPYILLRFSVESRQWTKGTAQELITGALIEKPLSKFLYLIKICVNTRAKCSTVDNLCPNAALLRSYQCIVKTITVNSRSSPGGSSAAAKWVVIEAHKTCIASAISMFSLCLKLSIKRLVPVFNTVQFNLDLIFPETARISESPDWTEKAPIMHEKYVIGG